MSSCRVWADIDELRFHENAIFLEACARSQVKEPPSRSYNQQPSDLYSFPWARDFLDYFALIASGSRGASNVSAACLELGQSNQNVITIRVAKNEDFNSQTRQRLFQICDIMNQVRRRGVFQT